MFRKLTNLIIGNNASEKQPLLASHSPHTVIDYVPHDVLLLIMSFLPLSNIATLSKVNKKFNALAKSLTTSYETTVDFALKDPRRNEHKTNQYINLDKNFTITGSYATINQTLIPVTSALKLHQQIKENLEQLHRVKHQKEKVDDCQRCCAKAGTGAVCVAASAEVTVGIALKSPALGISGMFTPCGMALLYLMIMLPVLHYLEQKEGRLTLDCNNLLTQYEHKKIKLAIENMETHLQEAPRQVTMKR